MERSIEIPDLFGKQNRPFLMLEGDGRNVERSIKDDFLGFWFMQFARWQIYEIEIGNSRRDKTSIFPPRMFLCFLWGLRGQWQILRLWVRASPCHSLSPLRMYVYLYNTSQYSKSLWKNEFHSKSVFLSPICL